MSSADDFVKIADAHAGVEEQRLFFADNKVGDGFFRLMRFVDGEDLRNDLIDFEPGITDRDTFESLVFGTRQGAAPFGFARLIAQLARAGRKATRAAASGPIHFTGYANSNSIFFAAGSSLAIRNLRICPARTASGLASLAAAPPFQCALSFELSDDKSGFAEAGAGVFQPIPSPDSPRQSGKSRGCRLPVPREPVRLKLRPCVR